MTAIDFLNELKKIQIPLFCTKDISDILGMPVDRTSKYLETLHQKEFLEKLSHGKWLLRNSDYDHMQIAEFLIAPYESYISLHSALFYHGMIEQVPTQIYSVTLDRTKTVSTPFGIFSYHHCTASFFTGYEYIKPYFKLASPEKSLVDYFYFSPSRSRQFVTLPELEIRKDFFWNKAYEFCKGISSPRTRSYVYTKLKEVEDHGANQK